MRKILTLCLLFAIALSGCSRAGDRYAQEGVVLLSEGEYESALRAFERAKKRGLVSFSETKLYYNIGTAKFRLDDLDGSIEAFETALKNSPDNFDCWERLGVVYEKKGDREKAAECYDNALLNDPEDYSSIMFYTNLGHFYISDGRHYSAIVYLEKARELDEARELDPSSGINGRNPVIFAWLAIAYAMDYQDDKSDVALDRAYALGYGQYAEVRERVEQIRAARPSNR
jgi:tetratricopeptide (TPR) repeat protein